MGTILKDFTNTVSNAVKSRPEPIPDNRKIALIPAAVLIGIVYRQQAPHIIFTKRTMTVATHKGQISFPGGVVESSDLTLADTALREAHEEIGIDPSLVNVVGYLDGTETITNFWITPVVGFVSSKAQFAPHPNEVEEVFEVPFTLLNSPNVQKIRHIRHNQIQYKDHCFTVDNRTIWGATGRILANFLHTLPYSK